MLILSQLNAFGIEEIKLDSKEIKQTDKLVSSINFEKILKLAKEHSYDIQLSDFNQLIARQGVRLARSEYLPKLNAMIGVEYTKNYRDYSNSYVTTVGDAFINPYTRYQNIFGLNLSYNVFDFGVRYNKLKASKQEVIAKSLETKQKEEELSLTLIDIYTKIILYTKQIELNEKILSLAKNNLDLNTRLYKAKEISKTQLNDSEVSLKKIQTRLLELKQARTEELNWLSFYTGENFDNEKISAEEIKNVDFDYNKASDYTKTTTWLIYEAYLKEKEYAYKAAKRNYLPKVNAYSRYYIYGSNYSSYPDALKDISPSSFTVGVSAGMPIFDGFINSANVEKARLEFEQVQIERDKAIAQWTSKLAILRSNLSFLKQQSSLYQATIAQLLDKEHSTKKLLQKKLISPIEYNQTQIDTLEEQINFEKNRITIISMIKAIEILTKE